MKRGTPRGEVGRYHKEGSHWVHWAGQKVHSVFSIPSHRKTLMNFLANPINAEEERWVFGWTHPPKWTHHFVSFSSSVVLVWVSIFSFGIKDTQILMARVSHFCPTCGYSNILSNMKSNSAIHWYKCFLGFHISWRTKLKLSGTRWNFFKKKKKRWHFFHSVAFLILSFHTSWKFLTWEVLCGWLNTLKTETIFPTPMSNPTPSRLPRLTATPPTSCLTPSLSGIYHQVFSLIPNVKCIYFFPSLLSLSLFLCRSSASDSGEMQNRLVELKVQT